MLENHVLQSSYGFICTLTRMRACIAPPFFLNMFVVLTRELPGYSNAVASPFPEFLAWSSSHSAGTCAVAHALLSRARPHQTRSPWGMPTAAQVPAWYEEVGVVAPRGQDGSQLHGGTGLGAAAAQMSQSPSWRWFGRERGTLPAGMAAAAAAGGNIPARDRLLGRSRRKDCFQKSWN